MSDLTKCPNCSTEIKNTRWAKTQVADALQVQLINTFTENKMSGFCQSCGALPLSIAHQTFKLEVSNAKKEFKQLISQIPIISAQAPSNWQYQVIDLITAQTVTGTGVLSEISSSFTDLFGKQSESYNNKLKQGEQLCFAHLRKQALELGANAIIATDIDYAEVGGAKGMLMVATAGTAIKLLNTSDVLDPSRCEAITQLITIHQRLLFLEQFDSCRQYI